MASNDTDTSSSYDASIETDSDESLGKFGVPKRRAKIKSQFSRETDEEKRAKIIADSRGRGDEILGHKIAKALTLSAPKKAKEFSFSDFSQEDESPFNQRNEPIAIDQRENEQTQEALPPARDSSSEDEESSQVTTEYSSAKETKQQPKRSTSPKMRKELSSEKKRVQLVQQYMSNVEAIYDNVTNDELNIVSQRCYNGCLKCSVSCFRSLKCCDCMDGCVDEMVCCIPCKGCTPAEEMTSDLKKASRIGSQLALTLAVPPSEILLLFWRSLELAFFVFSLAYAVIEAMEGFKDKRTLRIIVLVFGVVDSIISIFDNVFQWRDTCRELRDKRREKKNPKSEKETEANDVEKIPKGGGKLVAELMKKAVAYALIYPLLICDIYDIATATKSDPNGLLEYVVFGVGCFLTVVDVYLHRTYMLVKAARDIDKKRKEIVSVDDPMESTCPLSFCDIQWRLILHTVLVMIAHVFIIVAIAFEAIETNKDRVDGDEALVSKTGMFMIACGLVLPLFSLGLFVGVNAFWVRAYFIDLFKSICKEGEGLAKVVNDIKSTETSSRVSSLYNQVRSFETKAFRFADKIRVAFSDWRTTVVAVVYFALMIIFIVLSARVVDLPIAIGLAATSLIADLVALSVAFYWLFILALVLLVIGIALGLLALYCLHKICKCCSCSDSD